MAEGIWAYCVMRAVPDLPADMPTVHPGTAVEGIGAGGLTVLTSTVPLAEFGEDVLPHNLDDLTWLARVARAHEAVLEAALARTTIVPLRLCTIYRDDEGVRAMLDRDRDRLEATLELLDGRQEFGVKVIADPDAVAELARERSADAKALDARLEGANEAGAYLLRRRMERQLADDHAQLVEDLAHEVHDVVREHADGAVLNRPQSRELAAYEGRMVLNGAYLVRSDREDALRRVVEELGERLRRVATVQLTGPWPPYNFVPEEPAPAAMRS